MLAASLAERVLDDAARHARVPSRLSFHWRQGYASGVRCRSAPLPSACSAALRRFLSARASEQSGGAEGIRESLAAPLALSSLSLLRQNVPPPWNLTRIVVGVSFAGGGTGAQTSKEGTILAFMQRKKDKACSKAEDPEGLETPSPSPGHKENGGCREGGCQVLAGHTKKCRTTPETRMSNHLSPGQPEEGTGGCRGGKVSEEVSLSGIDVAEQWRILETIQKRQGQQRERGQRTIDSMFKRPLR